MFVIGAIILERNLQNVANYLVVSLAVADLLVACLVMPLGAVYEVSIWFKKYIFIVFFNCYSFCLRPIIKYYNKNFKMLFLKHFYKLLHFLKDIFSVHFKIYS